jgi:hypothetical protein
MKSSDFFSIKAKKCYFSFRFEAKITLSKQNENFDAKGRENDF